MRRRASAALLVLVATTAGCQSAQRQPAPAVAPVESSPAPLAAPPPVTPPPAVPAAPAPAASSVAPAESPQPPTGTACRVYLRRDALGMAGPSPLAPNLDAPLQRGTVVNGTIDQVTDAWLVLKSDSGRIWIPRNVVLLIEVLDH